MIVCLDKALHHLVGTEMRIRSLGDPETIVEAIVSEFASPDVLIYRNDLVREDIEIARGQLEKIKAIAAEKGYSEITAILDEQFEYGHTWPDPVVEGERR